MMLEEMKEKFKELKRRKDEFGEIMCELERVKTSHRVLSLKRGSLIISNLPKGTLPSCNINPRQHSVCTCIQGTMIEAGIVKAEKEIERIMKDAEKVLIR